MLCVSSNPQTSSGWIDFIFDFIAWMLTLGFHHIRVHAPGATESATVRNDFSCMICSSPLKEDVKFRVLGGEGYASDCQKVLEKSKMVTGYKRLKENCVHCYDLFVCKYVFLETDKQLVELIHVKALDALSAHQQSSLRYQSVTLFLRGRFTSDMLQSVCLYCSNTGSLYNCIIVSPIAVSPSQPID